MKFPHLFLSGYGLYESCKEKKLEIFKFYWKRLKSIYINYWMVFFVFTAIGWLGFREIFLTFLQQPYSLPKNLFINFLGIQYFVNGYMGYNPSWWFISQILLLYLLFPLLRNVMKKKYGAYVLAGIAAFFLVFSSIHIGILYVNLMYISPFIVGMLFSKYQFIEVIGKWLLKTKLHGGLILIGALIITLLRISVGLTDAGIRLDCILAPLYCCIMYYLFAMHSEESIFRILEYLGIHSFNIYLIHLFITNMYTTPYIYNLNSPFFMVGCTIFVSLMFSILIENIKRYVPEICKKIVRVNIFKEGAKEDKR